MGTLASLAPILGFLAGTIIARLTKSELEPGKKYFVLLQHALIAVIAGVLSWQSPISALVIGLLLFAVLWKTQFPHSLELTPLLAVPAVLSQNAIIPIFLYFIPTGTLHYKEYRKMILVSIVYALIVIIASVSF